MKLNQLRDAVAIAEQGSIRAAARTLRTGQPALTRSLAELERELGAPLFERRPRGVVATAAGQAFVRRAAFVLRELDRARDELGQLCGTTAGTVTVGLSIAAHLALLPNALRPFIKRYPETKLHIIEGVYPTVESGLRDGRIDFYVGVDPGQRLAPELSRELLSPNRRIVLCRAGHPLAGATSLAQLSAAKWATTSITPTDEDEVETIFRRYRFPAPKPSLRSQSALTLLTCLLNSDLLAMAPMQWNDFALARGMLTTVPVEEELAAPPMVVVKRADLPLTPAARHLLDLLQRGRILPVAPAARPSFGGEQRRETSSSRDLS